MSPIEQAPSRTAEDIRQCQYRRARRAVRALRGWYIHAAVYLAVNAGLWIQYLLIRGMTGPMRSPIPWPSYPSLFWGLAVVIHGAVVWTRASRRAQRWEDDKIREYLSRP